jgi:hypothetical protein
MINQKNYYIIIIILITYLYFKLTRIKENFPEDNKILIKKLRNMLGNNYESITNLGNLANKIYYEQDGKKILNLDGFNLKLNKIILPYTEDDPRLLYEEDVGYTRDELKTFFDNVVTEFKKLNPYQYDPEKDEEKKNYYKLVVDYSFDESSMKNIPNYNPVRKYLRGECKKYINDSSTECRLIGRKKFAQAKCTDFVEPPPKPKPVWERYFDNEGWKTFWYYNTETKISTWDKPPDFVEPQPEPYNQCSTSEKNKILERSYQNNILQKKRCNDNGWYKFNGCNESDGQNFLNTLRNEDYGRINIDQLYHNKLVKAWSNIEFHDEAIPKNLATGRYVIQKNQCRAAWDKSDDRFCANTTCKINETELNKYITACKKKPTLSTNRKVYQKDRRCKFYNHKIFEIEHDSYKIGKKFDTMSRWDACICDQCNRVDKHKSKKHEWMNKKMETYLTELTNLINQKTPASELNFSTQSKKSDNQQTIPPTPEFSVQRKKSDNLPIKPKIPSVPQVPIQPKIPPVPQVSLQSNNMLFVIILIGVLILVIFLIFIIF